MQHRTMGWVSGGLIGRGEGHIVRVEEERDRGRGCGGYKRRVNDGEEEDSSFFLSLHCSQEKR